jgi:hypothetical protein
MSAWWRGRSRVLPIVLLIGLVSGMLAGRDPILRALGRSLVVDEPVEHVDVILVPSWAGAAAAIDAADLVHAGISDRVAVLLSPERPADRELIRRGIDTVDLPELLRLLGVAKVELIPDRAAGTEAEVQVLLSWSDERQFRSIVVISSPDHSRRLYRMLQRSLSGRTTRLVIRSARYSSFDPDEWWKTRGGARSAIVELQKLLLDLVRHPF